MKGAIMNKTVNNLPFVYAPQTYKKIGAYGAVTAIAFIVMLVALYAPEISTIGEGIGLDYNLVP
jgi:hypothetical protein